MFKVLLLSLFLSQLLAASQCTVVQDYFEEGNSKFSTSEATQKKFKTIRTSTGLYLFSYEDAVRVAKKLDRKIMVIVAQAGCPAWNKFAKELDRDGGFLNKYAKELYVVALIPSSELASYPQYATDVSPTIFITTKDEQIIAEPIKGAPVIDVDFGKYLIDLAFF